MMSLAAACGESIWSAGGYWLKKGDVAIEVIRWLSMYIRMLSVLVVSSSLESVRCVGGLLQKSMDTTVT